MKAVQPVESPHLLGAALLSFGLGRLGTPLQLLLRSLQLIQVALLLLKSDSPKTSQTSGGLLLLQLLQPPQDAPARLWIQKNINRRSPKEPCQTTYINSTDSLIIKLF